MPEKAHTSNRCRSADHLKSNKNDPFARARTRRFSASFVSRRASSTSSRQSGTAPTNIVWVRQNREHLDEGGTLKVLFLASPDAVCCIEAMCSDLLEGV